MRHEICAHREIDETTGLSLSVRQDADPLNPRREWDHLGMMVCWHRRYDLGDSHDWPGPAAFDSEMRTMPHFRLPLYLCDHSGLTMSTAAFHCPWDSGHVGWIYVTHAALRKEHGVKRISRRIREAALALMRAEVSEYDRYLTGDVWTVDIKGRDSEIIDSCGGYYGLDYAIDEGQGMFAASIAERRADAAEIFAAAMDANRRDLTGGLRE